MPEIPLKPEDQELCRIHDYEYEQWGAQQQSKPQQTQIKKTNNEIQADAVNTFPTLEEIQKIRDEAFNEGFETGYKEGVAKGKKEGLEEGLKEGKEKGLAQGIKAGIEKGEKEGYETTKKQVEDSYLKIFKNQNEIWQSIIDRLKSSIDEQDAQIKESLTQLVLQICRGVFVSEMNLKPEHIQYIVKKVLDALPNDDQKLQVFVNSDDHAELEKVMDYHPNQDMKYTIDDSLQSGGCIVKAKYSYVDYSLTTRFQHQLKDLIESVPDLDWDTIIDLKKSLPESQINEADEVIVNEVSDCDEQIVEEASLDESLEETLKESLDEQKDIQESNLNETTQEQNIIEESVESDSKDIETTQNENDELISNETTQDEIVSQQNDQENKDQIQPSEKISADLEENQGKQINEESIESKINDQATSDEIQKNAAPKTDLNDE